jgi:hypothetical protein
MNYQTYSHNRNYGCRITEFVYQGYRSLALENEKLRLAIAADKGADIFEFLYKPRDVDFLWRSWTGMRAPYGQTTARAPGPFMDYYEGGWQELFPNCGNASVHQGAEIGQHGEVALLPWRYTITRDDPEEIEVRLEVRTVRTPFHLVKSISLVRNEAVVRIHERVTNESGQAVDFTWGHHPTLGWPFIDEHCRIYLPKCRIRTLAEYTTDTSRLSGDQLSEWPMAEARDGSRIDMSQVPGPDIQSQEMVFLEGMTDGWFAINNSSSGVGFGMRYPADIFKVLWYWQVYRGGRDYPWWSSTYCLALEPCASLPILNRVAKAGDALRLEAGESKEIEFLAVAFEGASQVDGIGANGEIL